MDDDNISTYHEENNMHNNSSTQKLYDEQMSVVARRRASRSNQHRVTGNGNYIKFSLCDATNDLLEGTELHGFYHAKHSAGRWR